MGSGVAKAVKEKWPEVYQQYMSLPKGGHMLGTLAVTSISDDLHVGNLYSQEYYGRDGKVYADIDAIEKGLRKALAYANSHELDLYLPQIGCGLGGLSWEGEVGPLLTKLSYEEPNVRIYVCVLEDPTE